jgi:hypothetical protein
VKVIHSDPLCLCLADETEEASRRGRPGPTVLSLYLCVLCNLCAEALLFEVFRGGGPESAQLLFKILPLFTSLREIFPSLRPLWPLLTGAPGLFRQSGHEFLYLVEARHIQGPIWQAKESVDGHSVQA